MNDDYVIVSLSTIPPRFEKLQRTLESLLNQSLPADEINLYIPKRYKRFGSYDLEKLFVPEGVTIKIVEHDMGPATKVLPCILENRDEKVFIVYCDDDRIYASDWLEELVCELRRRPRHVIVAAGAQLDETYKIKCDKRPKLPRAVDKRVKYDLGYSLGRLKQFGRWVCGLDAPRPHRKLYEAGGYVDIAMGVGGVALRPKDFSEVAFSIPQIGWPVDDIWLSGCLAINERYIWASDKVSLSTATEASNIESLAGSTFDGKGRSVNDLECIDHLRAVYGIWT